MVAGSAVRPIPIKVITVSKGASKGAKLFSAEWAEKVKRYCQLTEITLKPNPMNVKDPLVAVSHESSKVLKSVSPGEYLVVLDERGRNVKSTDMAALLKRASDQSFKGIAFAIGGPYGHSDAVREKADDIISLSSCVLNHTVAHVLLMEQLYRYVYFYWIALVSVCVHKGVPTFFFRGHTIVRGEPYHH